MLKSLFEKYTPVLTNPVCRIPILLQKPSSFTSGKQTLSDLEKQGVYHA